MRSRSAILSSKLVQLPVTRSCACPRRRLLRLLRGAAVKLSPGRKFQVRYEAAIGKTGVSDGITFRTGCAWEETASRIGICGCPLIVQKAAR
jgi:hypothetical protein